VYPEHQYFRRFLSVYWTIKTVRLTSASIGKLDTTSQIRDILYHRLCMQDVHFHIVSSFSGGFCCIYWLGVSLLQVSARSPSTVSRKRLQQMDHEQSLDIGTSDKRTCLQLPMVGCAVFTNVIVYPAVSHSIDSVHKACLVSSFLQCQIRGCVLLKGMRLKGEDID
jgi:hypothetical protein